MLRDYKDTSSNTHWYEFRKYDSSGRLINIFYPSVVTGYSSTYDDLMNFTGGVSSYLNNSTGLVEKFDYYTTTTATESSAGSVAGYLQKKNVQHGETGTAIKTEEWQYYKRTGGSVTVSPIATDVRYRNTDGTGGETTTYTYTWFSGTTRQESKTTSLPVISSSQNGPGSADTNVVYFDVYARPIWTKDGDGFLGYIAYDTPTGAVTKTILDVNTSNTSDFTSLPSGWSTPSGGGLHLITQYGLDGLGRQTQITDPVGNVSYITYN